jgi:O-6-methylguanine DNA methyltransferase
MMTGEQAVTAGATLRVRTAFGEFEITATECGVCSVRPVGAVAGAPVGSGTALHHAQAAAEALRRHAAGDRAGFDGALDVPGSDLQRAVWARVRAIPFGGTTTYGAIAAAIGMPGEARAVGAAVAANPVCILVPCHRVVASDGSLRGFAWGLDLKRRLLAHEGRGALSLFAEGPALSASPRPERA